MIKTADCEGFESESLMVITCSYCHEIVRKLASQLVSVQTLFGVGEPLFVILMCDCLLTPLRTICLD